MLFQLNADIFLTDSLNLNYFKDSYYKKRLHTHFNFTINVESDFL